MTKNRHVAKARDYLAKGDGYYEKAGREMIAAKAEGVSTAAIARQLGRGDTWARDIMAWAANPRGRAAPFADKEAQSRNMRGVRKALREATREQVREMIADLPSAKLDAVASGATDELVSRARARRSEHDTEPTAGQLTGGEDWDPAESWADRFIIRTNSTAHDLRKHVERWGLVLGSLSQDEAFTRLQEAERDIAEVRVIVQERVREAVA
jgi:hypothetical protein